MDVEVGGISARGNSRDYEGKGNMGKLIDSDIILSYINRLSSCGLGKKKALEYLRKYVDEQPEAVTRCEYCKDFVFMPISCDMCKRTMTGVMPYGYCDWGERRTDDTD